MAVTRKVLERVAEDQLGWKPHEKSMTLGGCDARGGDPNWGGLS